MPKNTGILNLTDDKPNLVPLSNGMEDKADVKPNIDNLSQMVDNVQVKKKTPQRPTEQDTVGAKNAEIEIINLTDENPNVGPLSNGMEDNMDVKPNVDNLSQMVDNVQVKKKTPQRPTPQRPTEQDREVIRLKSSLAATKNKLMSLQTNITKLLTIIVPDVDLGEADNINEIITEMIQVNSEQGS